MNLVYVFAVGLGADEVAPDQPGMADRPVRAVQEGPLAAFVSDVPREEFDEAPLNEKLRDLAWVTPRAIRHQEVNATLASTRDALVPLAFGTVFRDDDGVRRMLRERRAELEERLRGLRGKVEWIAVVRRDEASAVAALGSASEALRTLRDEIGRAAPGRAYLMTRQLDETQRRELRATDAEAVAAATSALEGGGATLFREPLVEEAGAGMLARYSALAPREGQAALERAAAAFAAGWSARGYALELTGPWPAYRFATVDPT